MLRVLILALLGWCTTLSANPLDLGSWTTKESFKLTSGWEFHWQTLLTPESPSEQGIALDKELCWQKLVNPATNEKFPSQGYGSYKISFNGLAPREEGYEIFMRSAATAYRAYLYAENQPDAPIVFANGRIGTSEDTSIPQPFPTVVSFHPQSKDQIWTLIIQVSNYHHVRSGLWQPPEIGAGDSLSAKNRHEREGYIFSIAIVLIIGIYSMMIYVRRRKDFSSLSLAVFCLIVAIRAFVTSDILSYYFPQPLTLIYNIKYAIEYPTIMLGPITYGAFVHFSFNDNAKSRLLTFQIAFALLISLFIFCTPPGLFTRFILVYQLSGMLIVVEYVYFLSRAVQRRSEGAALAFSGTVLLSLALIYDILVQHSIMPPPFISQYGVGAFVFLQSQVVATRFARAFNTAERLSGELRLEVDRQTANIRSLMDHVPLGIFTFDEDLTIGKAYSTQLRDIFQKRKLDGRGVLDVMFEGTDYTRDQLSIIRSALIASWGEHVDLWGLNAAQLPTEYVRDQQILEVDWHPIVDEQKSVRTILVTVRNVTQLRQLKDQADRREQDIQLLTEMIQVDAKHLTRFWHEVDGILMPLTQKLESLSATQIARDFHSMKGLARSLGLRQFTEAIHNSETLILGNELPVHELKAIVSSISALFHAYQDLFRQRLAPLDTGASSHSITRENLQQLEQAWLQGMRTGSSQDLQAAVKNLLCNYIYRSMDDLVRRLQDEGSKLARQLEKDPFMLQTKGRNFYVSDEVEQKLRATLMHLLNNALDHGFLPSHQRIGAAVVDLQWRIDAAMMVWTWSDNGRGLDLKQLAKKRGRDVVPSSREERLRLAMAIFDDGVSTAEALSQVSGRGIGMSAARSMLESLGGSMHIELLEPFDFDRQRFQVTMRLPLAQIIDA